MSQHTSDPATLRLPFKEKLAYGMGDLGSNILLDIGTLYLLKFYTDVLGLPGTYGGIIFLIASFLPPSPTWAPGSCSIPGARSARKGNSARSCCMQPSR
jgi:Na+/melibiose symporter and related transporters